MDRVKVPIHNRVLLTINEASDYCGIGEHTLRRIVAENPSADFIITNGNRTLIKRKRFEDFINEATTL